MTTIQLVVRRGPGSGEIFELTEEKIVIGRDDKSDIIFKDPEVSRSHCRLIRQEGYAIQDLGSTNGTFVDGQRLEGNPVALVTSQIIQLGSNVTLLYQEIEGTELAGDAGAARKPQFSTPDQAGLAKKGDVPSDEAGQSPQKETGESSFVRE